LDSGEESWCFTNRYNQRQWGGGKGTRWGPGPVQPPTHLGPLGGSSNSPTRHTLELMIPKYSCKCLLGLVLPLPFHNPSVTQPMVSMSVLHWLGGCPELSTGSRVKTPDAGRKRASLLKNSKPQVYKGGEYCLSRIRHIR